ncbi:GNAT family N-acetyltransferase [Granulosicoccaceae sp. 1_MG-2023]|nr:GNAT family N-acetyltransferase [Granulosicoccaceae sp. 1_MG-2023]
MIEFREIRVSDAQMLLDWRTSKRVTQFMNTDIEYDVEAQKRWLQSCYTRPDYYHWIIRQHGRDVGFVSLCDYDPAAGTASWGLYIGDESATGAGGRVPPYFYNFAFGELGLKRINAEVLYHNTRVIDLHRLHGYRFVPGKDRLIEKNGKELLLIALELDAQTFFSGRFTRYKTPFPMTHWQHRPQQQPAA